MLEICLDSGPPDIVNAAEKEWILCDNVHGHL
jgi:hypothetical protein